MKIKLISDKAKVPTKGSNDAAGYDLYTVESYSLSPGERHLFKTGLQIAIDPFFYGRIAPRSGLALKHGIDTLAGVIDADYRGEIGVILINLGSHAVNINEGDRIAQIIFEQHAAISELTVVDDLDENIKKSSRGKKGYGSTGK